MDEIIKIEGLSKEYKIGVDKRYKSLRSEFSNILKIPFKKSKQTFYALKDINLDVKEGENIGIIGKNGAGKSTLLKLISKITYPTHGKITYHGRMSSLLEVGTGFHPELTGRENVFFNGSLLGMKYQEIRRKMTEIIEFSGIEQFIDTPVKHFSSGMQLRLAFSIAAHLESDILLLDEVLAVGDAEFQKKCIHKMDELSGKKGKTIIFVSHNLEAIAKLCDKTIFLKKGEVAFFGETKEAISMYNHDSTNNFKYKEESLSNNGLTISDIVVSPISTANKISNFSSMLISVSIFAEDERNSIDLEFGLNNDSGKRISHISTKSLLKSINLKKGMNEINIEVFSIPFMAGIYDIDIYGEHKGMEILNFKSVLDFEVFNHESIHPYKANNKGNVLLDYKLL